MGLIFDEDNRLDLTRFDDDYSRIAQESDGWDTVPDGYYQARVEDVRLATTQTTGNPMLIWRLRITGPAQVGAVLTKTRIITAKTLGQVKRDLAYFGISLDRFSDLPEHLDEMVDHEASVYKKTSSSGWADVNLVRSRGAAAAAGPNGEAFSYDNQEAPF
ncbi:MAG TPA: DUF669 domain-containing protein [Bryobacteraceae bacterium]|nr:DUF669 domain-containing protein [Bryobacteraceae bacterium]